MSTRGQVHSLTIDPGLAKFDSFRKELARSNLLSGLLYGKSSWSL